MNGNQIFNMFMRLFGRRLVNTLIGKGTERLAARGKPATEMTPAERKAAQQMKQTVKRSRKAMRIMRRF